jgi:DNA-binding transcriptional LysR family regulator
MPALEVVRCTQFALVTPSPIAEGSGLAVQALPFEFPAPGSMLYWHREYAQDPALIWLRGLIRRVAEAI